MQITIGTVRRPSKSGSWEWQQCSERLQEVSLVVAEPPLLSLDKEVLQA